MSQTLIFINFLKNDNIYYFEGNIVKNISFLNTVYLFEQLLYLKVRGEQKTKNNKKQKKKKTKVWFGNAKL